MSTPRPNPPPLIVEWSRLLQLRELQPAGQPDVVLELIGDFLTDSERRIKLLHESAAAGKWRDVGHQAHTLKGAAETFGLCQFAELAKTLEVCAPIITPQDYAALIDRLDASFARAINAYKP